MNLYLDDNRASAPLANLLRKAGHHVLQPADVNLVGASDPRHLEHAIRSQRAVLTADRRDFWDLHELVLTSGGSHPGILLVRYDNDPTRDMKAKHIVTAIGKLERVGLDLHNQVVVLNQWR
jgi:predicted nuclease of predicted toxin-antitoxin system